MRFFSSPKRPDRLWGPPSQRVLEPVSRKMRGLGCESDHHLHLVPRFRMMHLHLHSSTRLHGVVLN
jgi:hypothetical protein